MPDADDHAGSRDSNLFGPPPGPRNAADLARASRLIDEVVRGARIPWRRGREELRAELWTHLEDSSQAAGGLAAATARLGDPAIVARGFRHVYRRDYRLAYVLKVAASLAASSLVALLVQVAFNLRVGGGIALWRLAPAFPKAALISVAVALGSVAAWESLRRPLSPRRGLLAAALYALASLAVQLAFGRGLAAFVAGLAIVALGHATSRLQPRPAGLLAAYAAFSIFIYGAHRAAPAGGMDLLRALSVSAALLTVWATSLAILARVDRAFHGLIYAAARRR